MAPTKPGSLQRHLHPEHQALQVVKRVRRGATTDNAELRVDEGSVLVSTNFIIFY